MNRLVKLIRDQNLCTQDFEFSLNLSCRVFISKRDKIPLILTSKQKNCFTKVFKTILEKTKLKCISNVCKKYSKSSVIYILTMNDDGRIDMIDFPNPNILYNQ